MLNEDQAKRRENRCGEDKELDHIGPHDGAQTAEHGVSDRHGPQPNDDNRL